MPFTGTGYEINANGHATDVVGYAYCTEEWCPRCILQVMGMVATLPPSQGQVASEIRIYGTDVLDLTEDDPRWYDTGVIPQPIFNSEDATDEDGRSKSCCSCHEPLIEQEEEDA